MDQKGLNLYEKRPKYGVFGPKIFLSGIGGYPPPPLTENHPAQKPLQRKWGVPLREPLGVHTLAGRPANVYIS